METYLALNDGKIGVLLNFNFDHLKTVDFTNGDAGHIIEDSRSMGMFNRSNAWFQF